MSNTIARRRLFSASAVGFAGLALAAVVTTGAVADREPQQLAAAPVVAAAAVAAAPAAVPAMLSPVAPAAVAPAADLLDATLERLAANAPGLKRDVLRLALAARATAEADGLAKKAD